MPPKRRRLVLAAAGIALAVLVGMPASAQQPQTAPIEQTTPPEPVADPVVDPIADPIADPVADPFAEPPPHDPDDAPFLSAPNNQLGQWSKGRERSLVRGFDDDHRFQLTLVPTYAALHLPFIGRGKTPYRGGGMGLELDFRIVRWLFVRVHGSHTLHPVPEVTEVDEGGNVLLLARSGLLQASDAGVALVYALDIGRFVPRVDVGAGLLFVRSPEWARPGQSGAICAEGNVCDLGLRCSAANICEPAPFPEVHAGLALDVLLTQRWALGVHVRYYAIIQAISQFPLYLDAGVRLGVRW